MQPEGWSREEDLLLLKATETHKLDWEAVSDAVPKRSRSECVKRFISLSVADALKHEGSTAAAAAVRGRREGGTRVLRVVVMVTVI